MTNQNLDFQRVTDEIEKMTSGKLNFREDLFRLIDIGMEFNKTSILEEIAFQAKYVQGLLKIIQNCDNKMDENYFSKIQKELADGFQKLRDGIQKLLVDTSDFIKNIFEEKFFQLTQQSLYNLNLLSQDLVFLKLYLNDSKRGSE
jgi:hypothetical protein